jgi:dTDP-4-amino-4,6-dideoxygalactose transaminase
MTRGEASPASSNIASAHVSTHGPDYLLDEDGDVMRTGDEQSHGYRATTRPRTVHFATPDIDETGVEAVARVLRSGWITTGAECRALEQELAEYLGVAHVVSMSSCTAALETAVAFLRLPRGAKIGIPTWTFAATALAAVHAGLQPILLDVEATTLNLDPDSLERAIDDGLSAAICVHFGGLPVSERIHQICADAGIPLVEDCAHSLGARDHRGMAAGQGTAGACFSFYATKNLTSGEGGALATDDDDLAQFARSYRLHGLSDDAWKRYHPDAPSGYDLLAAGIKGNLSDINAALARSQLRRFNDLQEHRRNLVIRYRANLSGEGVRFVPEAMADHSADHLLVVLLPEGASRESVVARLQARGISTSVHFQPLHTFDWFRRNAQIGPGGTTTADEVANFALSLPLHGRLGTDDVDFVCTELVESLA